MKKSYIALSLILAQALCAEAADVIADFSGKLDNNSNGNSSTIPQLKPTTVSTNLALNNAEVGTDWTGGTSSLNVKSNNLIFTFKNTPASTSSTASTTASNLMIQNGFTFSNQAVQPDPTQAIQATLTIQNGDNGNQVVGTTGSGAAGSAGLKTFTFGSATSSSITDKITLGSNLNLAITNFTEVKVKSNLSIGTNSTLDVSQSGDFTNSGGIILEGKDSTLKVKDNLKNDGTIIMRDGSKIESAKDLSVTITSPEAKNGSIIIQGKAEISSGAEALTIKNQDIKIQNIVSKKDGKVEVTPSELTLSATGANKTLTLGDTSKGVVNITGEIGNKNPSNIPNSEIPAKSEIGKLVVSGFTTLDFKNANFKNIALSSTTTTAMTLQTGTLGLENTTFSFGDSTASGTEKANLNFNVSGTSTITLKGANAITTTGELTITGTHTFKGEGTLDFVGESVKLGNGTGSTLKATGTTLSGTNKAPKIGVKANTTISTNKLTLNDLTLQAIKSSITNTEMTLGDSTLEAIDSQDKLSTLQILKANGSNGKIQVENKKTATLRGEGISIENQDITLSNGASAVQSATNNTATTLILEAYTGGVSLNASKIEGKNTSLGNNVLMFNTSTLTTQGKVEFNKLTIQSKGDLQIIGKEAYQEKSLQTSAENGDKGLFFTGGTTITTGVKGDKTTTFYDLTFSSEIKGDDSQAYVSLNGTSATEFKASGFTFQNQYFNLSSTGTGTKLKLYSYGGGEIQNSLLAPATEKEPKENLNSSGNFNFTNTTFADGTGSEVELFSGSEGGVIQTKNLTLENVSLVSKMITATSAKPLEKEATKADNSLNLTTKGSINVLGTSTISATKFQYSNETSQGVGVDFNIGNETKTGSLTLNASNNGAQATDTFILGGEVTLDLRGNQASQNSHARGVGGVSSSMFEIDLGGNKLSDHKVGLTFKGGGLTIIGKNGTSNPTTSHTFKAKSFTFEELKGNDSAVITSPFVKVQNADLTLEMANGATALQANADTLNLVGTLYLISDATNAKTANETKFKVTKATKTPATTTIVNGTPATNGAENITLKLHDIQATGKASVAENKLEFDNSNIYVKQSGSGKQLLLKDATSATTNTNVGTTDSKIAGTIASITLEDGNLKFQKGSSNAEITLKDGAILTSSGTSTLEVGKITVGDGKTGFYELKVKNGTFTLKEGVSNGVGGRGTTAEASNTGTQLGAITLGDAQTSQAGAGGIFEYKKNTNGTGTNGYNALTLRGDLTSYGASSIVAESFTIKAKEEDKGNYAISSTGGTLTLQSKATTANALELTADLSLKSGGLRYADQYGQNAELKFGSKSTISSMGNSSIEAKNLDINGAKITASEGTLTLKGISSSTKVESVSVGNAGVLRLEQSNSQWATLRVNDQVSLSASVPYITANEPLGNGVFGQIQAQSVLFEKQDQSALITLALSPTSASAVANDSVFALREGGIMLIDTKDGIKKKTSVANYENITLEDINFSLGHLTSISLQPYLKYGKDAQGKQIVEDLLLDLRVTQTSIPQLIESITNSQKREQMKALLSAGSNSLVIEAIMNSKDNPLKAGMAIAISKGEVELVANTLSYITSAFIGLNDSLYASHKIAHGLKMIRTANIENRMVRGKNPYLAKLEVAQLVKRALGVVYASSDDEILFESEESGIKDGELWASFDGAMGFSELRGNASVYGFSGGYDTLLGEKKNYLLGFYFGYGYGSYSANFTTNNSHNVSLGFYSRMSFENNEVDLILSQSIGLNNTKIDYGASSTNMGSMLNVGSMLKQNIDYNFYTTDIEARYGYVFSVGSKESPYYFKPFGGINFAMIVNSEGKGDGEAPIGIDSLTSYQLSVVAGVEMRKYFGENYLYWLPMIEKGLVNDGNGTKIGFVGSQSIGYNLPYVVDTGVSMYLGGQGNVGENIAVNGGVGVKVGLESKEILTNWNVGVRYKF